MKKVKALFLILLAMASFSIMGPLFGKWLTEKDLKTHTGFVRYHENGLGFSLEKDIK